MRNITRDGFEIFLEVELVRFGDHLDRGVEVGAVKKREV